MPKGTFTLYLAKPDVDQFEDLLSEAARDRLRRPSTRIVEAGEFGHGARLYVFVSEHIPPGWLTELRRVFTIGGRIETNSSCALLIFRASGRIFICPFAHGWMYLNEENLEGDFGLRVALNAVDDKKLKRLDRANLGDALRGVSLSPFQRDFRSFGVDDALDLVRKIGGITRDDASADTLTGSRSLKISGEFSIEELPEIASEALEFFGSRDYQETSFRVIDVVTPVSDPRLISVLDEIAVQSIRDRHDDFELGLPARYDDESVAYRFMGPRLRGRYPDLLLRNYIAAMGDRLNDINVETLRDNKIVAVYEDAARPDQKWSIRSALIGSIVHENGRYAINEGEWYRIDEAFKESIEASFQGLIEQWDRRPQPLRKVYDAQGNGSYQSEASYNAEIAEALGHLLLDQTSIQVPGVQRSGFEPCDLLDISGKRFIHVKKSSRRSNVLSHFFKQGANSAQQFKRFPAAWEQLEEIVRVRYGGQTVQRLVQAIDDRQLNWAVEFWVADSPRMNGEFNIPFFSKISLRDEASSLTAMSYRVSLRFIGLDPENI
ncbi:MAG: TIGR04141 family sporadically distributed protein [Alphaproteobacteria bacterium]